MIFVYLFDVSKVDINIKDYECLVSKHRQIKVNNCKGYRDKLLSLFAEILLNYGVNQSFTHMKIPVVYKINPNGMPYFDDKKITFSLSHSGDYAACAISNDEIGVDIQKVREVNLKISKRVFTKSENTVLSSSQNKTNEFFRLWVLKESYMKAKGLGFKLGFKSFSVDKRNDTTNVYSLYNLNAPRGYNLAVCKRGEVDKLKIAYVNIDQINVLRNSMDKQTLA